MPYKVFSVGYKRGMRDFIRLPYRIYKYDPDWVPPLESEVRRVLDARRNPYFENADLELLVCYRDREPVARAAVVINTLHEEKFGERAAFFGFFESMNDSEAARALFRAVEEYCRAKGAEVIRGPFNPNHYSELGLQISGFGTPPTFFQTYNPPYYLDLLEENGFGQVKVIHTRKNSNAAAYMKERFGDRKPLSPPPGYTIRSFSKRDFKAELERIREVNNDAFSENWHFLPLSREEYEFSAKYLGLVTYPHLIKIVEYKGKPVGVLQCALDINPLMRELNGRVGPLKFLRYQIERKKIRTVIVYAVGIKKAFQGTRAYLLLLDEAVRMFREFDVVEATWTSDDNRKSIRANEAMGMERDKEFAIYEKRLGNHDD